MFFFNIILASVAIVSAIPSYDLEQEWDNFQLKFERDYESQEEMKYRKRIFTENLVNIWRHNIDADVGIHGYRKGVNRFTDMDSFEAVASMGCLNVEMLEIDDALIADLDAIDESVLPQSIDYRELGAVREVKDQKNCGSCWAFSATGSIEGRYYLNTKEAATFSEQELVDCSDSNLGCVGGLMDLAFKDIEKLGGIAPEKAYPYHGKEQDCKFKKPMSIAQVTGYKFVKPNNEVELKKAVALHGPVSVAIEAGDAFSGYEHGIFYDKNCAKDNSSMNHAVLVVGYGSEGKQDYWIVKNSWGTNWGDEGYIRMSRNRNNNCNIATYAMFPHVKAIHHDD